MKRPGERLGLLLKNNNVDAAPSYSEIIDLCQIIRDACIDICIPDRPDAYAPARHTLHQVVVAIESLNRDLPSETLNKHWRRALTLSTIHLLPSRRPTVLPASEPPSAMELTNRASRCLLQWETLKSEDCSQR